MVMEYYGYNCKTVRFWELQNCNQLDYSLATRINIKSINRKEQIDEVQTNKKEILRFFTGIYSNVHAPTDGICG